MGFYAPAQIVRDARAHGVTVLPPCINRSDWDSVMEDVVGPSGRDLGLRLGLRQIGGLAEEEAAWIVAARGNGYRAVEDVWRRAGVRRATLMRLAEADAFAGLGIARRDAVWAARGMADARPLPLFAGGLEGEGGAEPAVSFPPLSEGEEVVEDYLSLRLTLRQHPVAFLRPVLTPPVLTPGVAVGLAAGAAAIGTPGALPVA
jgi:DNA polymerase III alpha subunit